MTADDSLIIELTSDVIDPGAVTNLVQTSEAGAVMLFLGTVREMTQGRQTVALDYEAFPEMALAQMRQLAEEANEKWPVCKLAIIHRLGHLELGEASVAIAVSTPHRRASFEAGQFLIDELKVRVPIWKKENWSDGTTEWVHPTLGTQSTSPIPSKQE